VSAQSTMSMGMLAKNSVCRIKKADDLMKGQADAVKTE